MKILLFLFIVFPLISKAAKSPELLSGEAKILYPCEVLEGLPKEEKEDELVTFFEQETKSLHQQGIILRRRIQENSGDMTFKYRGPLKLDPDIYEELANSKQGSLKCEVDVTFSLSEPVKSPSCSFKSNTAEVVPEHFLFLKMVGVTLSLDPKLTGMRTASAQSSQWKYKLTPEQKRSNPFIKSPSIERWLFNESCILEVSGKFKVKEVASFDSHVKQGFDFLKRLVKAIPSADQGSKTLKVLSSLRR